MTNNNELLKSLSTSIENSHVGYDNALTEEEGVSMAGELLEEFLIMEKSDLPEVKYLDHMVYAGDQAFSSSQSAEKALERALAFLAIAAKLTSIQAELKAAKDKEMNELLSIINEPLGTAQEVKTWGDLTTGELAAAREIKKLRELLAKLPLVG